MTTLFNGMANILNGVFGDAVTVTPNAGVPREIQGILREGPVELLDEQGVVVATAEATLKAHATDVTDLRSGDLIVSAGGVQYKFLSHLPSGSPASDAFVVIQLEHA